MALLPPIPYDPSVEVRQPDEEDLIDGIVASMARVNQRMFDKYRHGVRDAHAKSHGVLKGTLTVYGNLPEPYRQGIFASPRAYPAMVRLSSAPGDLRDDRVLSPRGMAIKLIGVDGQQILPERAGEVTQDLLLVNLPVIPFGHVAAYSKVQHEQEKHAGDSELAQRVTAELAKGANRVLSAIGQPSPMLSGLGPPNHHILGETFHSMAALRYGDYIAKISAAPLSENVRQLTGEPVDASENPSIMRDLVVDFFRRNAAEYEIRVQLCRDLEKMPVEDASIEWPEEISEHYPVAKLTFPAQDAYSPARRVYADDQLSFNPWHCIAEHQPLGSIMRVRIKAYESSSKFRHEMNAAPRIEPRGIAEMPD